MNDQERIRRWDLPNSRICHLCYMLVPHNYAEHKTSIIAHGEEIANKTLRVKPTGAKRRRG